ncbi:MAG: hypothetical protein SGI73_21795 [Chloroflexota bacterium]|mgnify:CR=1 FL=1|nr:hypothetical protein [Chloroflexota bacterium]
MAVHPDFRGRGLIKHVAHPVYEMVKARGGVAGVGFSNAAGVRADRRSRTYGYQVVGRMVSSGAWLSDVRRAPLLELSDTLDVSLCADGFSAPGGIHFEQTPLSLYHRYRCHPFRRYRFGIWREGEQVCGVVVYRPVARFGIRAMALLGAHSVDLPELLRRWAATIRRAGVSFAHLLTSPDAPMRAALARIEPCIALPRSRTPFYLTVKPLTDAFPLELMDFARWDCMGGDVL